MPAIQKSSLKPVSAKTTSRFAAVQEEADITCPFCWETLGILLDLSLPEQDYIEDCQVCCRPIRIRYTSNDGVLLTLEATQDT